GLEDRPQLSEQEIAGDENDQPAGSRGQAWGLGRWTGRGRFVHKSSFKFQVSSFKFGSRFETWNFEYRWRIIVRSDSLFAHRSTFLTFAMRTLHTLFVAVAFAVVANAADTGFIDKTFKDSSGTEHKYVLFVPNDYKKDTPTPTILFLHGAGETKQKE